MRSLRTEERLVGATADTLAVRQATRLLAYPIGDGEAQVLSKDYERVYTTASSIVWQDRAGIHEYKKGKIERLMPIHQARQLRLAGVQRSEAGKGTIYYVEHPAGSRYLAIQDGAVIGQSMWPLVVRERIEAIAMADALGVGSPAAGSGSVRAGSAIGSNSPEKKPILK